MSAVLAREALDRIDFTRAKLDIGCGARKRGPDYVGVDRLDLPGVDVVGDILDVLATIPDGVVDEIYCSHFLEHIDDLGGMLAEMCRVLRRAGHLEVVVPHFSNPYFASDPTHRRAFGLYTFSYLTADAPLRRQVPQYGDSLPLRLERVILGFKSTPPFYGRHAFKRTVGAFVNLMRWTREFYEENLVYLVPCYELRFSLVRL
ncbi:MAG: class I SAM-dependent methyltransferase [Thermoleophilaceae bacterium]